MKIFGTKFAAITTAAMLALLAIGAFGLGVTNASADPAFANIPGPAEIKYNGVLTEDFSGSFGNETTFGVGSVTTIQHIGGSNPFLFIDQVAPTTQRIFFVLYGIADSEIKGSGPFDIYNSGCTGGPCDGKIHLDFYTRPNGTPNVRSLPDTNRTNFSTFTGITDVGTPIMKLTLDTGVHGDLGDGGFNEALATLFQIVSSSSLPATGGGNFFASCVLFGGTDECGQFDTNGFVTNTGVNADFSGLFDLLTIAPTETTAEGGPIDASWAAKFFDPIDARAAEVPEPPAIALYGFAILTLVVVSRRGRRVLGN